MTEPHPNNDDQSTDPVAQRIPGSIRFEQISHGSGPALQAMHMQVNWTGDFVRLVKVPASELAFALSDNFVSPPGDENAVGGGAQFREAAERLRDHGLLVLVGRPGTGRRTLALRLLADRFPGHPIPDVRDLEPQWKTPNAELLPAEAGRFILDLSDLPDEKRTSDFCRLLADYGTKLKDDGRRIVVLLPAQERARPADEPLQRYMVQVRPPDARRLVERYLEREQPTSLPAIEGGAFEEIWVSNPSAAEAARLARIIATASDLDPAVVKDEYTGWVDHISTLLAGTAYDQWRGSALEARAMVWAGALLDGGQLESVLKAADALLVRLDVTRRSVDIMSGPTSSDRRKAGKLTISVDGRVTHDVAKHGLPSAILRNLLDEFPTEKAKIVDWAVSVAADKGIAEDDARLATNALLELGLSRTDASIIKALGTRLADTRYGLAVEALSTAAVDPQSGAFTRGLLYTWATSSSAAQHQLVAAVCGGRLGIERPDIALTRLWWISQLGYVTNQALIDAFNTLVLKWPGVVREALKAWLATKAEDSRTLGAVVAIGSSDQGAAFLVGSLADPEINSGLQSGWGPLLTCTEARDVVRAMVTRWCELASRDELPKREVLDFLSDVYAPGAEGSETLFGSENDFLSSFRGQVLTLSVEKMIQRRNNPEVG